MIVDHLDNWLNSLGPKDVASGNPQQASGLITQARSLWKTQAKGRALEDLMLDATGAPKDPAQVKSGFTTLFKSKAKMAQFTPDEKQAIAIVANGGAVSKALSVLSPRNPFGAVIATVCRSRCGLKRLRSHGLSVDARHLGRLQANWNLPWHHLVESLGR